MALSREIYNAFENVVGSRNISEEPAILESYRAVMNQVSSHIGPYFGVMTPKPQAVLLPASTDEVQKIILICNKYKIKFKASSTFWSSFGYVSDDNSIQLDMRRMNRIHEIDELNQFAVIEPGVLAGALQAEAMKRGMNVSMSGAGASTSILAGTSSWVGAGAAAISMGNLSENMLGTQWVLPDGEIIKTGSLGLDLGGFCGEGPGPSVRSIFRGLLGTTGSLGVCTKVAVRLHPWPGPEYLPTEGTIPAYRAALSDNFRVYTLCFPTWKAWSDALCVLFDSEIAYIAHRQFNMFGRELKGAMIKIISDPEKQLCDLEELTKDSDVIKQTDEMKHDIQVVIAGMTKRDFEYKKKVVEKILETHSGWLATMTEEEDIKNWSLLYFLRMGHKNLNFAMTGGYEGSIGLMGHPDFGSSRVESAADLKLKWEKEGAIAATGGDSAMGGFGMGGGGSMAWEFFTCFDSHDKASCDGTLEFFKATNKFTMENGWGPCMGSWCSDSRNQDGYGLSQQQQNEIFKRNPQSEPYIYQAKVRDVFDVNRLGDSYYKTLEIYAK